MDNSTRVVVVSLLLAALFCSGQGFWYSSSSSSSSNQGHKKSASNGGQWQGPPPSGVYSMRSEPFHHYPPQIQHGQLQFDSNGQPQFVALPLAVPIPAQLQHQIAPPAPMSVQNVQLVPCLCPIAKDMEYPNSAPGTSNSYMGQPMPTNPNPNIHNNNNNSNN